MGRIEKPVSALLLSGSAASLTPARPCPSNLLAPMTTLVFGPSSGRSVTKVVGPTVMSMLGVLLGAMTLRLVKRSRNVSMLGRAFRGVWTLVGKLGRADRLPLPVVDL